MLIGMLFVLLINTGCWDRKEINDIGLVMGTGLDLTDDGKIKSTLQIAVPSPSSQAGGAPKETEKFFLISAVGKNMIDLEQKLQQKMSRTLFFSHRSIILVGEDLARKGVNDILDTFSRNPRKRLKTYLLVVKGQKAEDMLHFDYPFELVPSEALKEMELLQGEGTVATLRDFLIASASEGTNPTTGVLEPSLYRRSGKKGEDKLFRINGTAVFKSGKLVGFLNNTETHQLLWFKNNKRADKIAVDMPGGKGNVGFIITSSKYKINTDTKRNPLKFHVKLKANGNLFENNSSLDVTDPSNLEIVKKIIENQVKQDMESFIRKIQTRYKTDIVGFGQQLQRDNPKKWRTVEKQWDRYFASAEFSVSVSLTISDTGAIGPPLQLKDKEIVK